MNVNFSSTPSFRSYPYLILLFLIDILMHVGSITDRQEPARGGEVSFFANCTVMLSVALYMVVSTYVDAVQTLHQ